MSEATKLIEVLSSGRLKKNPKKIVGKEFISLCLNGDVSLSGGFNFTTSRLTR